MSRSARTPRGSAQPRVVDAVEIHSSGLLCSSGFPQVRQAQTGVAMSAEVGVFVAATEVITFVLFARIERSRSNQRHR